MEPTPAYPFPGMANYGDDVTGVKGSPAPVPSPSAGPAPVAIPDSVAAPVSATATEVPGEPPFYYYIAGTPVDLATRAGLAACEREIVAAVTAAGDVVQMMVEQRQGQRRLQDLMARAKAAPLAVDDVIHLGQELARTRAELGAKQVDRRAISENVARLEQDRGLDRTTDRSPLAGMTKFLVLPDDAGTFERGLSSPPAAIYRMA